MNLLQRLKGMFGWKYSNGRFIPEFGGAETDAGVRVSPETSLQTIVVLRCATLIAGAAASLPIDVFERKGNKRTPRPDHPVERLLDSVPNFEMSSMDFRTQQWLSFLLWGNAYSHIVRRSDDGKPIGLWPLFPHRMEVKRNVAGDLVYRYSADDGVTEYTARDILHVRWYSLDGLMGLSAIEQACHGVGLHRATEKSASKLFKNGLLTNMQLKIPAVLKQPQVDELKKRLGENYGGADNASKVYLAEGGSELSPITIKPSDAQFLEQRGYNDVQICMLFGVPPHMVGLTEKSTSWGTGIAEQKQGFLDFTVSPMLTFFEKAYERCLLTDKEQGLYIKHNTKAFLRSDLKSRMEAYEIGIRSGMYSPNYCLALEDEDGYPGGDVHVMQSQMLPVEMLGKITQPSRPPKE
jgi:HK97 family phage portal protein